MRLARFGWFALACGLALAGGGQSADQKPATPPAKPPAKTPDAKPADKTAASETAKPKTLDGMKLPPGGTYIISRELPKIEGIFLTPEEHQKLLDQIDALKRLLKPDRPKTPGSCKLVNGQVKGDIVQLQAQFEFSTDRPDCLMAFGCQRAWLRTASLDGKLPLFASPSSDDGVVIQVEKEGDHQLTLDLALPVTARGTKGERGFELGLPRASITNLEPFMVPASVSEVRIGTRPPVKPRPVDAQHGRVEPAPASLGAIDKLEVSWKAPAPVAAKGKPLLAAEGKISVRVDERTITTDVDLTLQALRGEAKQWRILLPPQSIPELREPLPQDERIEAKELPTPKDSWLTIRLKEPSAEPLRVAFQISQPRKGNLVPIGPFSVQDTFRQRGTVQVRAGSELRLRPRLRDDLREREVTEDMRRDKVVAALSYWNVAAPGPAAQGAPSLLDLEIEAVKGAVETRVDHVLQQTDTGFQLITRIDATPIRTGIEQLELQVSGEYSKRFERDRGASPATLIEDVVFDEPRGRMVLKLAKKEFAPFSIALPAFYPVGREQKSLNVELPHPIQTLDRGGQATVTLLEGRALVGRQLAADEPVPGTRKHAWRWDRAPARLDFEWHEYQPEVLVDTLADITLTGSGQARVRQRLEYRFPGAPPEVVPLQVPRALQGRVQVLQGGVLGADGRVRLERPARTTALVFAFPARLESVRAPGGGKEEPGAEEHFAVPLLQPGQGTGIHAETKVRVWAEPGVHLEPADPGWIPLPTEVLPEKDSLPMLVLRAPSARPALVLRQRRSVESPVAPVVIERALVQVTLSDEGYQNYRARFFCTRLGTRNLDLEMPAPLSSLNLEVTLDDRKFTDIKTLDSNGKEVDNGSILRLRIEPELYTRPVVLDLRYQLAPARTRSKGTFHSMLAAPEPRGEVFIGRVRWQVMMPQGRMALHAGTGFQAEQRWEWHGGLLSPRPWVSSADLERWLGAPGHGDDADADDVAPGLVCARSDLSPFAVFQVPQQGWLFACSVLFLLVGLGLAFASIPRSLFWTILVLLGAGAGCLSISLPSLIPALVYGCEPGAAVLILIFAVQWMLHRHYHRQVVFLPGFTRAKASPSSVGRDNLTQARREPSTIDAPRRIESLQ